MSNRLDISIEAAVELDLALGSRVDGVARSFLWPVLGTHGLSHLDSPMRATRIAHYHWSPLRATFAHHHAG